MTRTSVQRSRSAQWSVVRKGEPQRKVEWGSRGHPVADDAVTRSLPQQARLVPMNFARRKWGVSVVAAVAASLLLTQLSAMTFAQEKTECTLPDCDPAKVFFSKFQKAIEANQKQEVVAMVRYPLNSAYPDGKATVFKTKSQLLAKYDRVFTPGVRCAIQSATLSDVWGNWRGFTISGARSGGTAIFRARPRMCGRRICRSIRLGCLA